MKATQQFIEDAIKGGWREEHKPKRNGTSVMFQAGAHQIFWKYSDILLDPLAWQAVGKTRGWDSPSFKGGPTQSELGLDDYFREAIHRFIDHLADGKTIEEALTLIN